MIRSNSIALAILTGLTQVAAASDETTGTAMTSEMSPASMSNMMRPDLTPASVSFGDMYSMGRWMLSYRHMQMDMTGNRDGSSDLSDEFIVNNYPNRFSGQPMQPATLRMVPKEMTGEMHMFGLMYMPSAKLNWMLMAPYVEKNMQVSTFSGASGNDRLGEFTTSTSGIGDIRVGPLLRLYEGNGQHLHLSGMLSIPTGSIDEQSSVLTPMNTTPTVNLPYPMQLGSGTFDLLPGLTWTQQFDHWSLGAQASANIHIDDNDEGYALGDEFQLSAWGSYVWKPWLSTSLQLAYKDRDSIDGLDSRIVGPIQTANPDYYGGEWLDLGVGVNLMGLGDTLRGNRLRLEYLFPLRQKLNGPQLEMDSSLVLRYQYMFMR